MLPSLYRKTPHQEIKEWYYQDTLILPQPSRLKLKFLLSTFKDCTWPCSRAVAMEVVWYQGWYKSAFVYPPRLHKKTWCSFKYWNEFQIILVGLVYCSGGFGAPFWYLAVLLPCSFLSFCPLSGLYPLAHTSPNCTTCCALTSHTWVHLNMTGIFPQLLKPPQAISSKIRELWT